MPTPLQLPLRQPHPLAPSAVLRELQHRGPVHRVVTSVGDPAWLVAGHAQVQQLLADARLGRSHPDPDKASRSGESALFGGPVGNYDTEQTDHARMRALLQPHFSPKRMRALRPADTSDRARSEQGLTDLFEYGRQLVAAKRHEPAEDVISRLCATDDIGDDEIASLSMSLLFAGHETTVVQIGVGALLLLAKRDQQRMLLEDPALVAGAVEEMLRARGKGGSGIPRYARTNLTIGEITIRAGDLVLLDTGSANHDPSAFADADRFDVTRREGGHVSFGHGARYCIGAPLARIELQAVFSQLPQRFPNMRLTRPVEELRLRTDTLTGGLAELPVTW